MEIKNYFTTVTPLSKGIALGMLVLLPYFGFFFGMRYQASINNRYITNLENENKNLYKAMEIMSPEKESCEEKTSKPVEEQYYFENCSLFYQDSTGNKSKLAELNNLGFTDPEPELRCLQDPQLAISESGEYIAFEDISGGIDSMVKIYSSRQEKVTNLYVYGTSAIFDIKFLENDLLAVLYGYPGLTNEQYLTLYNIKGLYDNYESNLLDYEGPETFSLAGNEYDKAINLTDFGVDYEEVRYDNGILKIYTKTNPENGGIYSIEFKPENLTF